MKERIKKISKFYGIGLTSLRRWINDKNSLEENLNKKNSKNLNRAGRITLTDNIEDHLYSFIKLCNFVEIFISSTEAINETIKLEQN